MKLIIPFQIVSDSKIFFFKNLIIFKDFCLDEISQSPVERNVTSIECKLERKQTSYECKKFKEIKNKDQNVFWEMIEILLENYKEMWKSYQESFEIISSVVQVNVLFVIGKIIN